MIEIRTPDDIQLGQWWTRCCECDLAQIVTLEDLAEARSAFEDEFFEGCWPTQREAVAKLFQVEIWEHDANGPGKSLTGWRAPTEEEVSARIAELIGTSPAA